jgi:hypothetical protein
MTWRISYAAACCSSASSSSRARRVTLASCPVPVERGRRTAFEALRRVRAGALPGRALANLLPDFERLSCLPTPLAKASCGEASTMERSGVSCHAGRVRLDVAPVTPELRYPRYLCSRLN